MILRAEHWADKSQHTEEQEELEYIIAQDPSAFKKAINNLDVRKLDKLILRHSITLSKTQIFAYLLWVIASVSVCSANEFFDAMKGTLDAIAVDGLYFDTVNLHDNLINYHECKFNTVYIYLNGRKGLKHVLEYYEYYQLSLFMSCNINEVIIKYEEEHQIDMSLETFKHRVFEEDYNKVKEIKLVKV